MPFLGELFFGDKHRFEVACAIAARLPISRRVSSTEKGGSKTYGRTIANTPHLHHLLSQEPIELGEESQRTDGGTDGGTESGGIDEKAVSAQREDESEEDYLMRTCR